MPKVTPEPFGISCKRDNAERHGADGGMQAVGRQVQ